MTTETRNASRMKKLVTNLGITSSTGMFLLIILVTSLCYSNLAVASPAADDLPGTLPPLPSVVVTPTQGNIAVGGLTVVKALVRTSDGSLAKNEVVTFTATPANGGTFIPEIVQTSPVDGKATTVFTASTVAQVMTIQAAALGVVGTSTITITAGEPARIALVASPSVLPADKQSVSNITATVVDAYGNPATGENVSFEATGGEILSADPSTNGQGKASATLRSGSLTGTAVVTASINQLIARTTVTLTSGNPAYVFLAVEPQSIRPGGSARISVTVVDAFTNTVSGNPVTITASSGRLNGVSSTGTLADRDQIVVMTKDNGEATAVLTGDSAGISTVTVEATGVQQIASTALTVENGASYFPYVVRLDNPLPALVNGDFTNGPNSGWEQEWISGPQDQMIVLCENLRDSAVKSGCGAPYLAWLGGRREKQEMRLSQVLTGLLPNNYNLQLRYRYFTFSTRANNDCNLDYAQVSILSDGITTEVRRYQLCSSQDTNQWVSDTINLGSFRNKSITLQFSISLSGGALGNFFLDDINLEKVVIGESSLVQTAPSALPPTDSLPDPAPVARSE